MAVEFAMLAIPFVTMLFAVLELGLIFMISLTLDNATQIASREIRTGTLQNGGAATANGFITDICSHMAWIQANCLANLKVDVRTYTTFTSAAPPNPVGGGVFNAGMLTFQPGVAQDIVVVRGYYHPMIMWIWAGCVVMVFGGVLSLSDRRLRVGAPIRAKAVLKAANV